MFKNHRRTAVMLVCSAVMLIIGAANAATKPLYRYYNPSTDDYYLTDVQASLPGYMYQGIAFNVSDQPGANLRPLYRCKVAAGFGSHSGKHHIRPPEASNPVCTYPWNGDAGYLLGYVHPYRGSSVRLYGVEYHPRNVQRGFWYVPLLTISQPEAQQYMDSLGSAEYKAVLEMGAAVP